MSRGSRKRRLARADAQRVGNDRSALWVLVFNTAVAPLARAYNIAGYYCCTKIVGAKQKRRVGGERWWGQDRVG